jgi:integrase
LETVMGKIPSLHPAIGSWLFDGPLAEHVPAYLSRLESGRYASKTIARYVAVVAHFAHWMALSHLYGHQLDESRVDQFLRDHIPQCGCPGPVIRNPRDAHAALMPLLALLRQRDVISDLPLPTGPIADELSRYDGHMRSARGLCEGTRTRRLRIIQRLLLTKFAGQQLRVEELSADDIRGFIAEQLELRNTPSNAIKINAALRDYLRWRGGFGDEVRPLLAVIASPPNWSLASLPRALTPAQVDRVLKSFTTALRSPKRGFAVVRLALDLGLRTGEINRLRLDDIDWQRGILALKHTKSKRQDVLPLPLHTGKALEDYIRHERPTGDSRALFVRHLAPHDKPLGVDGIRRIVSSAFRRVGIAHGGAHCLRHTLASRLVNEGSPIKEVADVLRHRSLNTSLIYAKLNIGALVEVALPWPGSAS